MINSVQSASFWITPFSVLFLMLLISGCDQGIIPVNEDTLELSQDRAEYSVSYVDGRLVFADLEAFAGFMNSFIESGSLSTKELGITDEFISLYASTSELEEENNEKTEGSYGDFEIVEDPFFASVLNEYGEIQIGSSVSKYTRNYVYKTSESNMGVLDNFPMRNTDQTTFYGKYDGAQGVEIIEIKRAHENSSKLTGKVMVTGGCTSTFVTNRRLGGASWITDFGNDYHSAGAKSRSTRKKWRKWVSNSIHEIDVSTEYTLRTSRHSTPISGTQSREGRYSSGVSITILADFGPFAYIRGSVSSNHAGMRRDSNGDARASCQSSARW